MARLPVILHLVPCGAVLEPARVLLGWFSAIRPVCALSIAIAQVAAGLGTSDVLEACEVVALIVLILQELERVIAGCARGIAFMRLTGRGAVIPVSMAARVPNAAVLSPAPCLGIAIISTRTRVAAPLAEAASVGGRTPREGCRCDAVGIDGRHLDVCAVQLARVRARVDLTIEPLICASDIDPVVATRFNLEIREVPAIAVLSDDVDFRHSTDVGIGMQRGGVHSTLGIASCELASEATSRAGDSNLACHIALCMRNGACSDSDLQNGCSWWRSGDIGGGRMRSR